MYFYSQMTTKMNLYISVHAILVYVLFGHSICTPQRCMSLNARKLSAIAIAKGCAVLKMAWCKSDKRPFFTSAIHIVPLYLCVECYICLICMLSYLSGSHPYTLYKLHRGGYPRVYWPMCSWYLYVYTGDYPEIGNNELYINVAAQLVWSGR